MRTRFIACEVCARHVREGDGACPFCGAKAPVAPARRSIKARLSRAALHAAGAAGAIASLNDCGGGERTEAFYGAPCIEVDGGACSVITLDAGSDALDAGYDAGAIGVFYGGSCVGSDCPDASPAPTDGGDASTVDATGGDAQTTDGSADGGG
ncbi:MAG TPA: hypothetical protein VIJ22_14190 [Polyangiaceae bacterium]